MKGELHNTNTLEAFKQLDKKKLLDSLGNQVSRSFSRVKLILQDADAVIFISHWTSDSFALSTHLRVVII